MSSYLTTTTQITDSIQSANCCYGRKGVRYMDKLEKGQLCKDDLIGVDTGFALVDAIVGYNAPSAEIASSGTVTLVSGTSGTVSAFVNGVLIGSAVFNINVNTTAANLATAITAFSGIRKYIGSSVLNVVTVTATAGLGSHPNGLILTSTSTGDFVLISTNFSRGVTAAQDKLITFETDANREAAKPSFIGQFALQSTTVYKATALVVNGWTSTSNITFTNSDDRVVSVPSSIGQYAFQIDTERIYIAFGTLAGNWISAVEYNCITLAQINNIIAKMRKLCNS